MPCTSDYYQAAHSFSWCHRAGNFCRCVCVGGGGGVGSSCVYVCVDECKHVHGFSVS